MTTKTGTAHFRTLEDIRAHYAHYEHPRPFSRQMAQRMVDEGRVFIGPPLFDSDTSAACIDREGRYWLITMSAAEVKAGDRYKIRRYFKAPSRKSRTIKSGLTLAEVQAHCEDYTSQTADYFDGWTKE
jgi:hypothetical protein